MKQKVIIFLIFALISNIGCKSDNPVKSSDYFIGSWYIKKANTFFYGSYYDTIDLKLSADNGYTFYGFGMFNRSDSGKWGFNDSNSVLTFNDKSYSVIQKNTDSMVLSVFGKTSTFILYKK